MTRSDVLTAIVKSCNGESPTLVEVAVHPADWSVLAMDSGACLTAFAIAGVPVVADGNVKTGEIEVRKADTPRTAEERQTGESQG